MGTKTDTYKASYLSVDTILLILMPIAATAITWLLSVSLFVSTLLFFAPPALYISLRRKDVIARSSLFALLITIISILTDYLAERDQSWVSTSSFNIRIAGSVPIEALVWVFLFTYLIITFFLFFHDSDKHKAVGKWMPVAFLVAAAVLGWLGLSAVAEVHFKIDYFYIKFGLLIILLPLLLFAIKFPRYIRIFLKISPYFIGLGLLNIIASLQKGYWSYPGHHYVGWVQLGSYGFPVEELLFWIILYPSFLIAQFEFFDNDHMKFTGKSNRVIK